MHITSFKLAATALLSIILTPVMAQEVQEISLPPFTKIVVGPHIDLELTEGSQEAASIQYRGIQKEDLHLDVDGQTLRIYLEGARISPKDNSYSDNPKRSRYAHTEVQVSITYQTLKKLKVRGEDEVICHSDITGSRFKLRAFGENTVRFTSVSSDVFVASMFGENELEVGSGSVDKGKYKFFGENEVDAPGLFNGYAKAKSFGESEFRLNVDNLFRVSSFGESIFRFTGEADVSRGFMFGENEIYQK